MTHVSLDHQPVAVRDFFLNLATGPDGLVLEIGGRPVAMVLPLSLPSHGAIDVTAWTPEQSRRRVELIDRKAAAGLTAAEEAELVVLQVAMRRYIDAVAPLPIEAARKLHQELVEKAARAGTGS